MYTVVYRLSMCKLFSDFFLQLLVAPKLSTTCFRSAILITLLDGLDFLEFFGFYTQCDVKPFTGVWTEREMDVYGCVSIIYVCKLFSDSNIQ